MHYIVDKEDFLEALSELEDELAAESLDSSGTLLSHCWRCIACETEFTAFEMIPAPSPCGCGHYQLLPAIPTLH